MSTERTQLIKAVENMSRFPIKLVRQHMDSGLIRNLEKMGMFTIENYVVSHYAKYGQVFNVSHKEVYA